MSDRVRVTHLEQRDHAYQCWQRVCLHFDHQVGTVDLDGSRADAQGLGNAPVGQPLRQQTHDLEFARCAGVEPLPQLL